MNNRVFVDRVTTFQESERLIGERDSYETAFRSNGDLVCDVIGCGDATKERAATGEIEGTTKSDFNEELNGSGGAAKPPATVSDVEGVKQSELDKDPAILGITPRFRAEIRKLIAADDPAADVERVVAAYMDRLRKASDGLKIEPNAAGDYMLPPEMASTLEKFGAKDFEGGVLESLAVLQDFDLSLPGWASPLVDEYLSGKITADRKEVLVAVTNAELAVLIFQLLQ